MTRRIRITIAYDGTEFHGWQVQPGLTTIQSALEEIVGGLEGKPVHVAGSGRTDAGVHARGQVAAFTLHNPIPTDNLQRAINRLLPPAIRVLDVAEVHADFHPRFDALAKTYRYTIYRAPICPPLLWRYVHHHPGPLDEAAMAAAAPLFEGKHDFRAFAAADIRERKGEVHSKVRTIFQSRLEATLLDSAVHSGGPALVYTVRGNGFLKHMVRNIVGTLIEVGRGNIDAAGIQRFLAPQETGRTSARAPAQGLCLDSVEYPPEPTVSGATSSAPA